MREKLINIIKNTQYGKDTNVGLALHRWRIEAIADNLIANGVTVPVRVEGYSFKDREIDFDYEAEVE
jgi:hypothetical protein